MGSSILLVRVSNTNSNTSVENELYLTLLGSFSTNINLSINLTRVSGPALNFYLSLATFASIKGGVWREELGTGHEKAHILR